MLAQRLSESTTHIVDHRPGVMFGCAGDRISILSFRFRSLTMMPGRRLSSSSSGTSASVRSRNPVIPVFSAPSGWLRVNDVPSSPVPANNAFVRLLDSQLACIHILPGLFQF